MDTTNLAQLTTDVSIYFGLTWVLCNNTISCLFIRHLVFHPYAFPIRAALLFSSFSTILDTASYGRHAANQHPTLHKLHQRISCREHWRNIAFFQLRMRNSKRWGGISGMWDPLEQHEWLYNRKSKETAHYWFEFELTVWCVQLGFGLLRAIFHGVQRVRAWYHIFDALVVLFHKTGTIKMAQTMHYVTSCLIRKLLVLLLSATLPLPN